MDQLIALQISRSILVAQAFLGCCSMFLCSMFVYGKCLCYVMFMEVSIHRRNIAECRSKFSNGPLKKKWNYVFMIIRQCDEIGFPKDLIQKSIEFVQRLWSSIITVACPFQMWWNYIFAVHYPLHTRSLFIHMHLYAVCWTEKRSTACVWHERPWTKMLNEKITCWLHFFYALGTHHMWISSSTFETAHLMCFKIFVTSGMAFSGGVIFLGSRFFCALTISTRSSTIWAHGAANFSPANCR